MPEALRSLLLPQPTQADGCLQLQPLHLLADYSKSLPKAGRLHHTCAW
jgi:hypothetical protein